MDGMRIEWEQGREKANMEPLAEVWCEEILKWFEDPENERRFQEEMMEQGEMLR